MTLCVFLLGKWGGSRAQVNLGCPSLSCSNAGLINTEHHTWLFLCGFWGSNCGLCFDSKHSLTEPPSQPLHQSVLTPIYLSWNLRQLLIPCSIFLSTGSICSDTPIWILASPKEGNTFKDASRKEHTFIDSILMVLTSRKSLKTNTLNFHSEAQVARPNVFFFCDSQCKGCQ